jgi:ribosomal protein S12 methylthiotransferase
MISLGCAKILSTRDHAGKRFTTWMEITSRPEDADVLVVNTCAFIDSAKEESIGAILKRISNAA